MQDVKKMLISGCWLDCFNNVLENAEILSFNVIEWFQVTLGYIDSAFYEEQL